MSDPTDDEAVVSSRTALATEMRRGMHLLLSRDAPVELTDSITATLRQAFDQLDAAPDRVREMTRWSPQSVLGPPADGEAFPDSPERPVSGAGHPFSVPMTTYRDGDGVRATVELGPAFQGAPGRSHGGFVSAIFDDLLGFLPSLHGKIAFTAWLKVDYLAPSPVFEPVEYRAWIDRVEGRKMFMSGEARHDDVVVSTASGLFIDSTEQLAALFGAE